MTTNVDYMKKTILHTKERIDDVLVSALDKYEELLPDFTGASIEVAVQYSKTKAKDAQSWLMELYAECLQVDSYISFVEHYYKLVRTKVINLANYNHLGFQEKDLLNVFRHMQSFETLDAVNSDIVSLIAKQAESTLQKNSLEYRIIRLLCVFKEINILNTSSVLAKLLESQSNLSDNSKLSISADVNKLDKK